MCGIVGYIGDKNSTEILIDGLKKLEYRGYDSAGVAVFGKDGVNVVKAKGRIKNLEDKIGENVPQGVCGIGHTRWATHGAPSDVNSHPHRSGKVTLVHNGIIENYSELREEMRAEGRVFVSETDTEVAAQLSTSATAAIRLPPSMTRWRRFAVPMRSAFSLTITPMCCTRSARTAR